MTDAPPRAPDTDVRGALCAVFSAYDEESIAAGLGGGPGALTSRIFGLDKRVEGLEEPLRTLVRLFHLCREVDASEVEQAIGRTGVDAMARSGLIALDGDRYRPTVRLSPFDSWLVAADPPSRHAEAAPDFVLGPFGTTRRLSKYLLPGPFGSVLDLGCGGGALALSASPRATRVVATDVNERALEFARFNTALNGADHVEARAGSLFEPVRGERFDLIVCNPPYVISPDDTFVYRDGGTEICREIVRSAPGYLSDGGRLQMLAEWPQRPGSPWYADVEEWLTGLDVDAWVLREYRMKPEEYASTWLKQEYHRRGPVPDGALERWLEHLASLGIEAVAGGLVVIAPARGREPIQTFRDMPPHGKRDVGPSLHRWLSAQSLFHALDGSDLLDAPLVFAPTLERVQRDEATGDGWIRIRSELRPREGLRFAARVDPIAEEVVGMLGPNRTARQVMKDVAGRHGVPIDPFLEGLPRAIAKLLELGLVVPADSLAPQTNEPAGADSGDPSPPAVS